MLNSKEILYKQQQVIKDDAPEIPNPEFLKKLNQRDREAIYQYALKVSKEIQSRS